MTLEKLAKAVVARWENVVVGDYVAPACPTVKGLAALLRVANYAAGHPEEGRYPRFNVTATKTNEKLENVWRFEQPRSLTVAELRRLIPATDSRKSAVHVQWDDKGKMRIMGIHDLGTSWHRARIGLEYSYTAPASLLVEIERPNRLSVFQGQFRIASFADGEGEAAPKLDLPLFLHSHANGGLHDLAGRIREPENEPVREYAEFAFMAMWNTYAAIANMLALAGHGGTLIIVPSGAAAQSPLLRRKYSMRCSSLSDAFVDFLNARHAASDLHYLSDSRKPDEDGALAELDWQVKAAFDQLVEATRLVAKFGECDGAIVLTSSLEVVGFGCEIAAELRPDTAVFEVIEEIARRKRRLDLQDFGMRHRSAVKLASQMADAVTLVISQDGPISAVWNQAGGVYVRKGVRLVNINLPWA